MGDEKLVRGGETGRRNDNVGMGFDDNICLAVQTRPRMSEWPLPMSNDARFPFVDVVDSKIPVRCHSHLLSFRIPWIYHSGPNTPIQPSGNTPREVCVDTNGGRQ